MNRNRAGKIVSVIVGNVLLLSLPAMVKNAQADRGPKTITSAERDTLLSADQAAVQAADYKLTIATKAYDSALTKYNSLKDGLPLANRIANDNLKIANEAVKAANAKVTADNKAAGPVVIDAKSKTQISVPPSDNLKALTNAQLAQGKAMNASYVPNQDLKNADQKVTDTKKAMDDAQTALGTARGKFIKDVNIPVYNPLPVPQPSTL